MEGVNFKVQIAPLLTFSNVQIAQLNGKLQWDSLAEGSLVIQISPAQAGNLPELTAKQSQSGGVVYGRTLSKDVQAVQTASSLVMMSAPEEKPILFMFAEVAEATRFLSALKGVLKSAAQPVGQAIDTPDFGERVDAGSADQYFLYYGKLANQQNMLQDVVRTSTYQKAILDNRQDFAGKVVLDVGCGSGILSFFAEQAGARRVYAIEASSMAGDAMRLVAANRKEKTITVINGRVEEISLPEKVDVIISEPLGTLLVNERMLESYVVARDRFLKEGGKMFPSGSTIFVAPFSDDQLYAEQMNKTSFWSQNQFYGVDLTALKQRAVDEKFSQPIVDCFDPNLLVAQAVHKHFDFLSCTTADLKDIEIPFQFRIERVSIVHGLAAWFDAYFNGSTNPVTLSTAPGAPPTHWYSIRCLLKTPLAVNVGQMISGKLVLTGNRQQSFQIDLNMSIDGIQICSSNTMDLKDPEYRGFYNLQATNMAAAAATMYNPYAQFQQQQQQNGGGAYLSQQ